MKYRYKIILIFLAAVFKLSSICGQTDTATLKISYKAAFKSCVERPQLFDDMILLVGKHSSSFYSATNITQQQTLDSVVQTTGGNLSQVLAASSKMRASSKLGQHYVVLKNYPIANKLTYTTELVGNTAFKYEEDMPTLEWELLDGDSIIAEYSCNKARTAFRGRVWTVWYTPDITISEGPWKLCGLPGLILKAVSDNAEYTFECTGIQKGHGEKIAIAKKNFINTNAADLQKLEVLTATDPQEAIIRLKGVRGSGNIKKRKLTPLLIEDLSKK